MRRVQLIVEDWQYQYLRDLAERNNTALSAVLREIINREAAWKLPVKDSLLDAAGLAKTPLQTGDGCKDIDERLYRRS
jgi:hypothetical protein